MSVLRNYQTPAQPEYEEQPEFFLLDKNNWIWKLATPGLILFIVWIYLSGVISG